MSLKRPSLIMFMFYLCMINEACLVSSEIVDQQQLIDGEDRRQSPLPKRSGNLDTSLLVKTSTSSREFGTPGQNSSGKTRRHLECNFLVGCYHKGGRIQCKANLARKGIVENSECVWGLSWGRGNTSACHLRLHRSERVQ
jgi:hypothetical protein